MNLKGYKEYERIWMDKKGIRNMKGCEKGFGKNRKGFRKDMKG